MQKESFERSRRKKFSIRPGLGPTLNSHAFLKAIIDVMRSIQRGARRARKRFKHTLVYGGILGLLFVLCRLPRRRALALGGKVGVLAGWMLRKERERVRRHWHLAFGDGASDRVTRQVFVDLGKNAVDALRLRTTSAEELQGVIREEGFEHFDRALAQGKGVIALTGHIGNWELLGAYVVMRGYPLHVVGRRLNPPQLDRLVVENRERAGVRNIARGKSTRTILYALRNREMVGFLIDQDTKVDGVFVDFFGRPAYTPVGPVVLAMKTGAPIVPVAIHREVDDTHHVVVREAISLVRTGDEMEDRRVNTERCSRALERFIREHPTQWVWMHGRWKTRPEKGKMKDKR